MSALRKPTADLPVALHGESKTPAAGVVRPVDFTDGEGENHASPARALQQRLEQAALQSFYAVAEPEGELSRWGGIQRIAIILVAAVGTWALLFGVSRNILA
jgi:hypothetical protein